MPIQLPYQYNDGDYKPDSFEDITQKNITTLARQVSAGQRVLHGCVSSSGAFVSGTSGWTPVRTGTGAYTITFDSQFASPPTLHVTGVTGVGNGLATPSNAAITMFNVGGGALDAAFYFSAEL